MKYSLFDLKEYNLFYDNSVECFAIRPNSPWWGVKRLIFLAEGEVLANEVVDNSLKIALMGARLGFEVADFD